MKLLFNPATFLLRCENGGTTTSETFRAFFQKIISFNNISCFILSNKKLEKEYLQIEDKHIVSMTTKERSFED